MFTPQRKHGGLTSRVRVPVSGLERRLAPSLHTRSRTLLPPHARVSFPSQGTHILFCMHFFFPPPTLTKGVRLSDFRFFFLFSSLFQTVKYEEVEQNVPSLPRLRKCASNVYSVEIIKKMELAGALPLQTYRDGTPVIRTTLTPLALLLLSNPLFYTIFFRDGIRKPVTTLGFFSGRFTRILYGARYLIFFRPFVF